LGKGGKPDLEAAARSVLRDWNTGKIAYHTEPPKLHPSSKPSEATVLATSGTTTSADVGQASIVKEWGAAFDLAGLLDEADKEVFGDEEEVVEDQRVIAAPVKMLITSVAQPSATPFENTSSRKRARSFSVESEEETGAASHSQPEPQFEPPVKRLKLREDKKFRIDSHELSTLGSSNPLNRSKLRKAAKRAKREEARSNSGALALADRLSGLGVA